MQTPGAAVETEWSAVFSRIVADAMLQAMIKRARYSMAFAYDQLENRLTDDALSISI